MSSGWRAPAPLPMYQPVVLKHVPTMVRRRYDHLDLNDMDRSQDTPTHDGEIQNDGDIDEDVLESKNITSDQGGCISEDDDDLEASNLSHQVDNGVSVECQQSEVENSIEDCETETQSKRVDNDLQSEYSECDNDGSDIVNNAPTVEWTLEDETRDKRLASFSNEQGSVSEDDDCDKSEMEHLEFIVDTDVKDETLDNGLENSSNDQVEGQHNRLGNSTDDCVTRTYTESISSGSIKQTDSDSENSKSKDDGSNGSNHALIVDSNPHEDECHEAKHKRLASLSNEQALHSKYRENEDDEPKVADHAPIMVRGRCAPPPLPMYHPVVLQHVPTMVKRRYDHFDTDKLDQIEGSALSDDECDGSDMEHSSCIVNTSVKGWRESEDDDLRDSNPSSEVDDGISDECQINGEENSTDNCETGTYCESVGTRSIKPIDLDFNLDEDETKHKRLAFLSHEQALHLENSESDDDVPKLLNHVPFVEFNHESGILDKRLTDFSYEEGNCKDEYNGPEDAKSASYPRIIDEGFDMIEGMSVNEQGLRLEENKRVCHLSDGNSPFYAIVSLNSEAEEMGRGSFDGKQDMVFKTKASMKSMEEDRCKFQDRCSPPPLPMYQPVTLKHVPTMVRKRYERSDAEPLRQIEDVPTNDGEIEDDGDLDDEDGLLSEQGWHERKADDLQNSNSSSTVDSCVSVECQQSGVDNSIDDCETGICDESVRNRSIQPTDLHSGNRESEDDESKVANNAPIVDSNHDEGETQDKRLTSLALHSEYSESKDDEPKFAYDAPIVVSNLENEIQDKRLVDFSNEEGDSKDEYNEAEDAKTANIHSAKYESLDVTDRNSTDEQGLHSEDNKRDGDISEENPSFCTNASLKSKAEMIECGSIDDDKHDTITQMYTEDFGTQNIIRRRRSLDIMNLKSESNGTEDINSSYTVHTAVKTQVQGELSRYSNYQIEFKPETLRKSTEEDVYELMCPYCKHCFTSTLIVQRKENSQHCRITCFTSLIALFCCGRD